MRSLQLGGLATFLGLSFLLPACSSGGGGSGGPMFVENCSLGCSNGQGGTQVSCSIVNVGQNVEITVLFSEPVKLSSVNSGTFRVINTENGAVPVGTYSLDPVNPRRLIFRPALTFDAVGNPIFALEADRTYQITIPGAAQGDPTPYIQSTGGKTNQSRLQCTIRTSEGLLDPVPGPPSQKTTLQVRKTPSGEVLETIDPANGATDVPTSGAGSGQETVIRVVFDDIMNPATLANLSTGQSSTITVKIDPDGNLVDATDQVDQAGFFSVEVDLDNLRTTLEFVPTGGFPSGGREADPTTPGDTGVTRLIVMNLPPGLLDLVGNQLANPQQIVFRTETIPFAPIVLPQPQGPDDEPGEGFENENNQDALRSGALWGSGRLTYGTGGGSGRLGDLVVQPNQVLEFDTDSMDFPLPGQTRNLLDNSVPGVDYVPTDPGTWPTITVEDGAFEFGRVDVQSNGRLVLRGENAARLFASGRLSVASGGFVDLNGGDAPDHISNTGGGTATNTGLNSAFGGPGGPGGPAAGAGGMGGDRLDHTDNQVQGCNTQTIVNTAGGIAFAPAPPGPPNNPGTDNDGRQGEGVGGEPIGGGTGGLHWPPVTPRTILTGSATCFGNAEFVKVTDPGTGTTECRSPMVGAPGGGGGYALPGDEGVAMVPEAGLPSEPGMISLLPPTTPGGDAAGLMIEPPDQPAFVRRLDFHQGNLRGGSGGGGGGAGLYATRSVLTTANPVCVGPSTNLNLLVDHSAAGGGGGGGALQIAAGRQLVVSGFIQAIGGQGGSSPDLGATILDPTNAITTPDSPSFAAPGGGGSGGAVRLQSRSVEITALPGRVSVLGGEGGMAPGGSEGGQGGPGLVRIEMPTVDETDAAQLAQLAGAFAPSIAPFQPGGGTEPGGFNYPYTSGAILSVGDWSFQRQRPDSFSASTSCWMKPQGNFFELEFLEDDDMAPDDPEAKAWNMDIIYVGDSGEVTFPYRGIPNDPTFPLTGEDFEEFLGNLINRDLPPGETGSLLAVRFQGARAVTTGPLPNPCNVQLSGLGSEIENGSLTPWVQHPAELNQFEPRPNMIRFCVVFEEALRSQGMVEFRVQGVTNLGIQVQPN